MCKIQDRTNQNLNHHYLANTDAVHLTPFLSVKVFSKLWIIFLANSYHVKNFVALERQPCSDCRDVNL